MTTNYQNEIHDTLRIECIATPREIEAHLHRGQQLQDRHIYYAARCVVCGETCVVRSDHVHEKVCLCQKARHRRLKKAMLI